MAGIVGGLEEMIRQRISSEMPTQAGYLDGQRLVDLIIDYRVWRERFVQPCPRKIHRSAEMNRSPKSEEYAEVLREIEAKLNVGESIESHLSFRVKEPLGDAA